MHSEAVERALQVARQRPLILASGSPRRRELLRQVGLEFEAHPPEAEEGEADPSADPSELVVRHAEQKARSVARESPSRLVLGADTVVVIDGHIMGKPADAREAKEMLAKLSGRTHQVYTGVALAVADGEGVWVLSSEAVKTAVMFRKLTHAEIEEYVATGEPLDKAGAYGIQERGALLVSEIHGCYGNVVGLPLSRLGEMLRGLAWQGPPPAAVAGESNARIDAGNGRG